MFNNIICVIKSGLKVEEAIIRKVNDISGNKNIKFIPFQELKKEHLHKTDLVITLGGDGTFVKAANLIDNSYILGINAEPTTSEGALLSIDIKDIEKLSDILNGKFSTIIRQRAKVKLNGKILDEHAVNEVYLGALSQFHSSRYTIKFGDKEEEHRSSGIIVSTGTGSPAWFYSAGGKEFKHDEEKLSFIIREPYYGKRIFKPTILQGDIGKNEKLIIESKRDFGGVLAINDSTYPFNKGDCAEIDLSDKPLKVVVIK